MKQRIISLVLAALPLLFASCDKDEYTGDGGQTEINAIRFDISIGTATPDNTPQLRSVTYPDFTSAFETGDQVGLFIVKGNGGLLASGNWVDNMKMTFNGTGWDYTLPAGKEYFPNDGSTLSFYAYYPYDATLTNPLAMSFAVQTDQSTATNQSKSDLMTASAPNVAPTSAAVPLTFTHKMVLMQVIVTGGGPGAAMNSSVQVHLKGCKTQATVNLATGSVNASDNAPDVLMQRQEDASNTTSYTYRAIVPQQPVASGTVLFGFTRQGVTLKHTTSSASTLTGGEARKYDIALSNTLDPNHVYAVGNVYPYKGFPEGVVFAISNGGKNGKIVSLDIGTRIVWSTVNLDTGATDLDDGVVNTNTIKALPNWQDYYPAFKWCADYGANWYLPAKNEVLEIVNNRNVINLALQTVGRYQLTIALGTEYWTSTDINSDRATSVFWSSMSSAFADIPRLKNWEETVLATCGF